MSDAGFGIEAPGYSILFSPNWETAPSSPSTNGLEMSRKAIWRATVFLFHSFIPVYILRKLQRNCRFFQAAVEVKSDEPKEALISRAKAVSQNRLLTQEEFAKLRTQQALKEIEPAKRAVKRKHDDDAGEEETGGGCV